MRWCLADVAVNMEAANALVFRAVSAIQRGQDVTVLAAQAKCLATATAIEGIQACMQAMGAIGASAAHPLAMHAAEVRMSTYADGTSEMLRDRSGKSLLATYPTWLAAI
jgi:alkylation response protein AidB-like acyl-CoA dehydrogenase